MSMFRHNRSRPAATLAWLSILSALAIYSGSSVAQGQKQQQQQQPPLKLTSATPFGSKQLYRCRQSCYHQFSRDWHYCTDFADCRNCWNDCQQQLASFTLHVRAAQRQGALVLTDIAWDEAIANASRQCLITWEVSGGGLMGNLLTDAARAELSLWPDTAYNIQVTCKHKLSGLMRRSIKLNVDTRQLIAPTAATAKTIYPSGGIKAKAKDVDVDNDDVDVDGDDDAASVTLRVAINTPTLAPSDKVYIISALPKEGHLGGVIYPAFGALAFFLGLLVLFLFLRPQRKRLYIDGDKTLLLSHGCSTNSIDNVGSTLHV